VLQTHDHVPHFQVTTIDRQQGRYDCVWQHRPLVLVCLESVGTSAETDYLLSLETLTASGGAAVVITRDPITDVPRPGALVADQWGEIYFIRDAASVDQLPAASELAEWLQWVQMKCPECEGEAK